MKLCFFKSEYLPWNDDADYGNQNGEYSACFKGKVCEEIAVANLGQRHKGNGEEGCSVCLDEMTGGQESGEHEDSQRCENYLTYKTADV